MTRSACAVDDEKHSAVRKPKRGAASGKSVRSRPTVVSSNLRRLSDPDLTALAERVTAEAHRRLSRAA